MPLLILCKECGKSAIVYSTAQPRCPKCQLARSKPKLQKPISKVGKQGKKTVAAVAKWKRQQKSNDQGYHVCYLCGKWITYLRAEHKLSKVRHPDKRTDPENLAPTCDECNADKGSQDYTDFNILGNR